MQSLALIINNSLTGIQTRKGIDEFYKCKSEHLIQTEYDGNVLDFWRLPNGNYIVKLERTVGLGGNDDVQNT